MNIRHTCNGTGVLGFRAVVFFLFLCSFPSLHAQQISAGTSFVLCFMDNMELQYDEAVFRLYVVSSVATDGMVRYQDQTLPFIVQPGTPTAIDIPKSLVLAYPGAVENKGVLLETRDTVVVYGLNHAPKTSDAFLAYPVSALDTVYRTMCWPAVTLQPYKGDEPPSQFAVVGAYDSTDVVLYPHDYTWNFHKDTVIRIRLNRGETYLVKSSTFEKYDMTGSLVQSSKPVAVFSGHKRAIIPQKGYNFKNYDHLVEQMPPLSRWDSAALIVPHPSPLKGTRLESPSFYRVLAAYDSTVLYIDGRESATLNAGAFWQDTLQISHHVFANLPILAAQFEFSTPTGAVAGVENIGDPFMLLSPPVAQYLPAYLFVSMPFNAYRLHYITLTIPAGAEHSLRLDGNPLPDSLSFLPVGTSGYSYGILQVAEGAHEIRSISETPFGLMVYGYGLVDSYGYIGGMKLDRLLDRFDYTAPSLSGVDRNCRERIVTFRDSGDIISGFIRQNVETSISNGSLAGVAISPDSSTITLVVQTDDPTRDNTVLLTVRDRRGNRAEYRETIAGTRAVAPRLYSNKETTFSFNNRQLYCDTMTVRNPSAERVTLESAYFRGNSRFSVAPLAGTLSIDPGASQTVTLCIDARDVTEDRDTLVLVDTCGVVFEYALRVQGSPVSLQGSDGCGNPLVVTRDISGKRSSGVLMIVPNPVRDAAEVQVIQTEGEGWLEVVDEGGRVVRRQRVETGEVVQSVIIELQGLPDGIYGVRVMRQGRVVGETVRAVIVR